MQGFTHALPIEMLGEILFLILSHQELEPRSLATVTTDGFSAFSLRRVARGCISLQDLEGSRQNIYTETSTSHL